MRSVSDYRKRNLGVDVFQIMPANPHEIRVSGLSSFEIPPKIPPSGCCGPAFQLLRIIGQSMAAIRTSGIFNSLRGTHGVGNSARRPVLAAENLYVVAGVLMSGECFCPSRAPKRHGNCKGLGTPLPKRAVSPPLLVATAAPVLGTDGASCWKRWHRVELLSRARWCAAGARS